MAKRRNTAVCPPPMRPTRSRPSPCLGTVAQNVILAMVIGFAAHPLYAPHAALVQRPDGICRSASPLPGWCIFG